MRTDGQTEMTKLTVAVSSFANALTTLQKCLQTQRKKAHPDSIDQSYKKTIKILDSKSKN
jgi:hypothetical protein